jgi:hypothetical protein
MSFFDYCLPLLVKLPVILTTGIIPILLFITVFSLLKLAHLMVASAYFGEIAFFITGVFLVYSSFSFNSKFMLRRIVRNDNNGDRNPLFIYPHPLIRGINNSDTSLTKIRKRTAIALIELKAYTFANGLCFIIMYFLFLFYMNSTFSDAMICTGDCQIYRYGVKSLGSGILFDFFDAFDIRVSNVTYVSFPVRIMSFVAKLVLVGLVIHVVTYYFTLKRRFKSELRSEALTPEKAKSEIEAARDGRTIPRTSYKLVFLPPWLNRKNK